MLGACVPGTWAKPKVCPRVHGPGVRSWHPAALQVGAAYDYLARADKPERPDMWLRVRVRRAGGAGSARGVYLRSALDARRAVSFSAEVAPQLHPVRRAPAARRGRRARHVG